MKNNHMNQTCKTIDTAHYKKLLVAISNGWLEFLSWPPTVMYLLVTIPLDMSSSDIF